jgi:hypothetical protein
VLLVLLKFSSGLVGGEVFEGLAQDGLDCGHFCLLGWDLQLQLFDPDGAVFGTDDFAIHVVDGETAEEDVDAKVWQSAGKLYLAVAFPAVLAVEGAEHNFTEEGDADQ